MARRKTRANIVSFEHHEKYRSRKSDPFDAPWRMLEHDDGIPREQSKYTKNIQPRSPGQGKLLEAIRGHALTLALGPAGSGKTYLAVTAAIEAYEQNKVSRIVLTRPAIEAGESLGFLPGSLQEKMDPYLRPLFDTLVDRMGSRRVKKMLLEGEIEIAPVAYMRGRTLNNAFVVIDEAQNCTYAQLKMLLTRLGWNSTMVVTGDPDQSDLLNGLSGLTDIARKLAASPRIAVIRLNEMDIVRHPLVAEMIEAL